MNRYMPITLSAIFLLMAFLPCQAWGASIKEKQAAIGEGCTASGDNSTAMGYYTEASGDHSTAMGWNTTASGNSSTATGSQTTASGYASTAMGYATTASGDYSCAGGSLMRLTATADHTFVWGDSYTEQFISTPNAFLIFPAGTSGNVGIGTPSPGAKLHIKGNNWPDSFIYLDTNAANQDAGMRFYENGTVKGHLYHDASVSNCSLRFHYEGHTTQLVLNNKGWVGIGTSSPGYLLEVDGSAGKPNGGSWSNSSDVRLKDITGEYDRGLNQIVSLKPVTFYYKEGNPRGLPSHEEYIGFIAQEVQNAFPEAISEGEDGYLDFNMHPINVAFVNAIKELKAENEILKTENRALRQDIEQIRAILGL